MAKYKVLKTFTGLEEGQLFRKSDQETEFTVKRADEINAGLKDHGVILERTDDPKEDKSRE